MSEEQEPGEAYYDEIGWSGCAGSAWRTLPPATKDGWAHAERLVAGLQYRMAEAWERGNNDGLTFAAAPQKSLLTNPYRSTSNVNTPATLRRVAKPPMVMRSIRVPLRLWNEAREKADEREENISDVIREALERYVKRK